MVDPALGVAVGYNHFVSTILLFYKISLLMVSAVCTDIVCHFRVHGY